MEPKTTFWKKIGLQDLFLPGSKTKKAKAAAPGLTPDSIYQYILQQFKTSIAELSFAGRVVFYHEYMICFNAEDYKEFLSQKQGLFGIIVDEVVKQFYQVLKTYEKEGKKVQPSSSKWVFRLVSHPDYERGDIGFIGKLLPGSQQKEDNLRVTFIPRQTGVVQTFDVNEDILKGFTYYSEGYYELPYAPEEESAEHSPVKAVKKTYAKLDTIMPDQKYSGKKFEYLMKDEDIIVSGAEEERTESNIFRIPSEWVDTPHLRIRFNSADGKLYLASFGEKTIINEQQVLRSNINAPVWTELPINSKVLLNGIIGINIFKG
ncbi:hypothetical protein DBR11_05235 [Pedobacter sp. HMWF019]|uniref:hypothetical protein n=1 Tax=Pedobacter sp. HMWF019 TaxID=2056856 RepID=UPI000D365784|nr:hypothetical protein [Pedobacter sp. HMWF019]PTT02299.1 hypothetical protein DBR11_05235 [Pedobacter sp. HMWF019]